MTSKLLKYSAVGTGMLAFASSAMAQVTTITLEQPEGIGVSNISQLISAVFNAAIVFAILFVFGMLIMGGYGWLTAGGDKAKVEEARTRITNAIIGLAIVASAWALITIISRFFGVDFTSFELESAAGNGGGGGQLEEVN